MLKYFFSTYTLSQVLYLQSRGISGTFFAFHETFSLAQDLLLMSPRKHAPRIEVGWNWSQEAQSDMECQFTRLDSASTWRRLSSTHLRDIISKSIYPSILLSQRSTQLIFALTLTKGRTHDVGWEVQYPPLIGGCEERRINWWSLRSSLILVVCTVQQAEADIFLIPRHGTSVICTVGIPVWRPQAISINISRERAYHINEENIYRI
jgi:hypothetical protein